MAVSVITTLVTPYLIRATDGTVAFIERAAPRPLMQGLFVYTSWIGSFGKQAPRPLVLLVRRMTWQMLVNLLLTIGVFLLGRWIAGWDYSYLPVHASRGDREVHEELVWLGVMVITSPIYLASARKIQAMAMLIAEICVPVAAGAHHGSAARMVIGQVFVLVSFVVMTFVTVLLSTSILGSVESKTLLGAIQTLLPLLLIATVAALLFRPILVRIYSRAEIALHETLVELPRLRQETAKIIPDLLHEAEIDTVEIPRERPGWSG